MNNEINLSVEMEPINSVTIEEQNSEDYNLLKNLPKINGTTVNGARNGDYYGLQDKISSTNKISAAFVDDSTSTNKFVTSAEKSNFVKKNESPTLNAGETYAFNFQTSGGNEGKLQMDENFGLELKNETGDAGVYLRNDGELEIESSSEKDVVIRRSSGAKVTVGESEVSFSGTNAPQYNNSTMALASDIKNATITLTQDGTTRGSFTLNQSSDSTIDIPTEPDKWEKPADWVDIRSGAVANSIYLLVAHPADYSQYDYLAFTANVSNSGTYDVYIDGLKYNTFSSGSNAEIQWSVLNLSTGYDVTYPSALHTHIVRITPTSTSNTLTKYTLVRHSSLTSNTNYYGILWLHFTLTNSIDLRHNLLSCISTVSLRNLLAEAFTSANGKITTANEIAGWFYLCSALKTVPLIESTQSNASMTRVFEGCSSLKTISLKGVKFLLVGDVFKDCTSLTEIKLEGSFGVQNSYRAYSGCTKLKAIPNTDFSGSLYCDDFIKNATSLGPTFLDLSAASTMTNFGAKGDSTHFISGLKGIVVSSSAPFNGATSPRLNLAYTGLDRIALVTLFNSMPTVSDSQVCNITGATGASDLTAEDLAIATGKGWTITR